MVIESPQGGKAAILVLRAIVIICSVRLYFLKMDHELYLNINRLAF